MQVRVCDTIQTTVCVMRCLTCSMHSGGHLILVVHASVCLCIPTHNKLIVVGRMPDEIMLYL